MSEPWTMETFEMFLLAGGSLSSEEFRVMDEGTREAVSEAGRRVAEFRGECVAGALLDAQQAVADGLVAKQEDARVHMALHDAVDRAAKKGAA